MTITTGQVHGRTCEWWRAQAGRAETSQNRTVPSAHEHASRGRAVSAHQLERQAGDSVQPRRHIAQAQALHDNHALHAPRVTAHVMPGVWAAGAVRLPPSCCPSPPHPATGCTCCMCAHVRHSVTRLHAHARRELHLASRIMS